MTTQKKRVAVFLNAPVSDEHKEKIRNGTSPRHDILSLTERLGAELILAEAADGYKNAGSKGRAWHLFRMGWQAFRRRKDYDVIVTDLDAVGTVLAFLLKLTRSRKGHIIICHGKLAGGWQAKLTRRLKLHSHVDYFVSYGVSVGERLVANVGIPDEKVKLVKHPADHQWWKPMDVPVERLISSAGMTRRDYTTLANAVRDLDVQVQIAAYSPWVDPRYSTPAAEAPDNVTFTRLPQDELRELYARSMFIVVPLQQSISQAGSLVIYESMAMGKAVIVAETDGEKALGLVEDGITGLYYEPGNADDLREKIQYLLDNPQEAERLGEAARARVERELNMDRYFDEVVALVEDITGEKYPALPARSESQPQGEVVPPRGAQG